MSEQKRVPFQTLGTSKKEKKGEDSVPSYRFSLTLPESNEQACPEFNYRELLKSAEKKRKKENKKGDENNTANGLDPHDEDDEDKLQEMAKRFEAKYGTATTAGRKKHNRYDDYVDLGAGYDESDSFIDNTDAYDEIVPEEWTTVRGGFYINSGPLEFKTSEGNSLIGNNNNNNNIEDETSESSDDETEELPPSPKQSKKRPISSSEDEETEDPVSDNPAKKPKLDDNGEKTASHDVAAAAMKKKKKQQQQQQQQELSMFNRQKNTTNTNTTTVVRDLLKVKRELRETDNTLQEDQHHQQQQQQQQDDKKKIEKQDSHTKPNNKGILDKNKFDIKRFEKKTTTSSSSNGQIDNNITNKKFEHKKTRFYDDTIESVVNAARVDDQSSSDTMDSGKSRSIVCSNSDCDDPTDKEESPLPEALNDDVKDIINKLKLQAENSKEGKTKFFSGQINSTLFSLEKKLRLRYASSVRLATYAHLSHFLPCSKPTLLNRAKKLYLQNVEERVKNPLERLKAAIDKIMPSVMVKYTRDCQRTAEDKGVEGSPTDPESSDGDDSGNKSSEKTKIPQRRFPWTDETKRLVFDIAAARREYFEILKPRKETVETFVSSFMDSQVRPLWPPGWVRLQTLLKYSNPQLQAKRKSKKHKDGSAPSGITSGSLGLSTTSSKTDFQISNNTDGDNQARVKSPTNVTKTVLTTINNDGDNLITGNSTTTSNLQQSIKSTDMNINNLTQNSQSDKKTVSSSSKSKDNNKNRESPITITNSTVAKISVVPTAQLMPSSNKSKLDKFNPMDLTSSSLSITPVNEYNKSSNKPSGGEYLKDVHVKKEGGGVVDTISITPCPESGVEVSAINSQSGNSQAQISSLQKPVALKHRILQESCIDVVKIEDKVKIEKDFAADNIVAPHHKTESSRKEKKEKRSGGDGGGRSHHKSSHESKKRKKEHSSSKAAPIEQLIINESGKIVESCSLASSSINNSASSTCSSSLLMSKEEQEQRQIEETMAATNFLSQIINDDDTPRPMTEKRKEAAAGGTVTPVIAATTTSASVLVDENNRNIIQNTSEQENDVQMVMRSLKELQELQEMTCSPSHSPPVVSSIIQKSSSNNKPTSTTNSNNAMQQQYVGYQDQDYQHLYHKKNDDKIRTYKKDDAQW